jgi:hypothetical protein
MGYAGSTCPATADDFDARGAYMTKKNRKGPKVGQGMKPRFPSATAVQQEEAKQPAEGVSEPVESIGSLEGEKVQNLDQVPVAADPPLNAEEIADSTAESEAVTTARKNLEDLMRDTTTAVGGAAGGEMTTEEKEAFKQQRTSAPRIIVPRDKMPSIADIEAAMDKGSRIQLEPDGAVFIGPGLGLQKDGTFGIVLTLPEGLIDPIREQAESDKISPEEWCRMRFLEYIESWWSAPKGR